jgi:DNA invertase Pin-like site-specific DNA recombinase
LAKVKTLGNVDRVFKEKASGDTLVVTRADRIAHSAADLLTTVHRVSRRKALWSASWISQNSIAKASTLYTDFLLTVLAAVAQIERDILDEKRRDGIAAARAKGVWFGRPRLVRPKPWR